VVQVGHLGEVPRQVARRQLARIVAPGEGEGGQEEQTESKQWPVVRKQCGVRI